MKAIGSIAGTAWKYWSTGVLIILFPIINGLTSEGHATINNDGYTDAVNAIMKSDMWDSNKREAVLLLKRNEDTNYYKTIIHVIESDMWDSNKIEMIEYLSK